MMCMTWPINVCAQNVLLLWVPLTRVSVATWLNMQLEHGMSLYHVSLVSLCNMSQLGIIFMHDMEILVTWTLKRGKVMIFLANVMTKFSVFAWEDSRDDVGWDWKVILLKCERCHWQHASAFLQSSCIGDVFGSWIEHVYDVQEPFLAKLDTFEKSDIWLMKWRGFCECYA